MKRRVLVITTGAMLAAGLLAASPAHAGVISTFDAGDEGWAIVGDAQDASVTPTYHPAGGNPGGYISATDDVLGGVWYFSAPTQFLGDQSAAYGQSLTFDLKQSGTHAQFNNSDVVLIGGGRTIVFDTASNPGTDWTSYTIALDASAGWRLNSLTGAAATQSDIRTVLASLTALRIRGEYITGADVGSLDNVVLTPEPGSLAVLTLGALAMLRRGRRSP